MPANRINGHPIALDGALNRIVRYQVAANRREAEEVLARLPYIVSNGLDAELGVCQQAHRYDMDGKRAYYFQLDGNRLHIWIWHDVDDYVEAGNLLSLVVSLDQDLSEAVANEVYLRATGRSVNQPPAFRRDRSRDAS
jgi:hypothetical protein